MNYFSRQQGLTLIELLVVMTILALVLGLGNAGFSKLIEGHEKKATLKDLYGLFQAGRNAAVSYNSMVTICPLNEGNSCSNDWNGTIHMFLDQHNERELTSNTEILRVVQPPRRGTLDARPAWKSYFQFRPIGSAHGTLGNITYCPGSGNPEHAGRLLMNMGGRLRYAQDLNGDGIVQGSDGQPISCD